MAKKKKSEIIEIDDVSIKEYDPNEDNDLDFDNEEDEEEDSYQVDDDRDNKHDRKKDDRHKDSKREDSKRSPLLFIFLLAVLLFGVYYYIYPSFFDGKPKRVASPASPRTPKDLDFINNRKPANAQKENNEKKQNENEKKEQPTREPLPLVVNNNNFEEEKRNKQEKERKEKEEKEKETKRLNEVLSKYTSDQVQGAFKKFDEKENLQEFRECLLFLEGSTKKTSGSDSKKALLDFEKEKKSCRENLETKAKNLQAKFEADLENLSITEEKLDIFKREANILYENCRKDLAILTKKADTDYDKLIDKTKKEFERIKEKEKEELKKSIQEAAKKIIQDFVNDSDNDLRKFYEYMNIRFHQPEVVDSFEFFKQEGKISDLNEKFLDTMEPKEAEMKKIIEDFKKEINDLSERNEYEKFKEESEKIVEKYKEKIRLLIESAKTFCEEFIQHVMSEAKKGKKEKERREQEEQSKREQEEQSSEQEEQEEQPKEQEEQSKSKQEEQVNGVSDTLESVNDFLGIETMFKNLVIFVLGKRIRDGQIEHFFTTTFPDNVKDITDRITNNIVYCNVFAGYLFYFLYFLLLWYIITAVAVFVIFVLLNLIIKPSSLGKCFKIKNIIFAPFYGITFNSFYKVIALIADLFFSFIFFGNFYKNYYQI